jgi:glycosyltransferase involved in cell wall biosynthesis
MSLSYPTKSIPAITVSIPVFNAAATIEYAVLSVLKQSFQDWELLILNDGSTDASMAICKRFNDPRIRIIDDGVNRGLVERLNSLPSMAKGKYLARMDADDIMHPERLAKQFAYLEANTSIDVVDCGIYIIDQQNRVTGKRKTEWGAFDEADLLRNCLFTHPAVMGRIDWFVNHKYDNNFYRAEDYELWLRAFKTSNYGRITEPLLFYREGNVSVPNYTNSMKAVRRIFRTYGPKLLSPTQLKVELFKSLLKEYLYRIFGALSLQRVLAANRNQRIKAPEAVLMQAIIDEFDGFTKV